PRVRSGEGRQIPRERTPLRGPADGHVQEEPPRERTIRTDRPIGTLGAPRPLVRLENPGHRTASASGETQASGGGRDARSVPGPERSRLPQPAPHLSPARLLAVHQHPEAEHLPGDAANEGDGTEEEHEGETDLPPGDLGNQ